MAMKEVEFVTLIHYGFIHIFRLLSGPKGSATYGILTSVPYQKVWENNIDPEESFDDYTKNMDKTLSEPNMAYFDTKSYVLSLSQYHCKVSKNHESIQQNSESWQHCCSCFSFHSFFSLK